MKTNKITISLYMVSIFIIHFVYIAVFLGIFVSIPKYIRYLNIFIQVFLCFILMIKFHPYRENLILQNEDKMFIFGASFVLFTNVVLVELSKIPFVKTKMDEILSITPKPISLVITKMNNIH